MDIIKLLEYLQEIIETSSKVPITGKAMVDKKEVLEVIDKIINNLPDEFKKAQWVYEEKERILSEAVAQSDEIKNQNMELLKKQIENHDITREAEAKAQQIISSAQRDAKAMRLGARDYADEVLSELDREINSRGNILIGNIKKEAEDFFQQLESKITNSSGEIRENIKELRNYNK
ncbi:ATPase [Clostridium sp. JN-9]|uniref:ATPase n=1 Tax=Clostridium sp. JN-9 TaxID=2507159 RepID=UPI000FFE2F99|nr:ATPase [Clostridium sp. JN-9]QAT40161.1 ATPase [Clostridium sp. JN-9]